MNNGFTRACGCSHNHDKSCCDELLETQKVAIQKIDENGNALPIEIETTIEQLIEINGKFASLITTNDEGEKELRVDAEFGGTIEVDNTDVVDAIQEQTTNIIANDEANKDAIISNDNANVQSIIDAINAQATKTYQAIVNQFVTTPSSIQTIAMPVDTIKVIVKVNGGTGKVGFQNGIKYDYDLSIYSPIAELLDSNFPLSNLFVVVDPTTASSIEIEAISLVEVV